MNLRSSCIRAQEISYCDDDGDDDDDSVVLGSHV